MKEPIKPSLYADVFEDDLRGAAILEELIQRFSRPAVQEGGIDAVLKTYHRMGARSVVEFIVARINQSRGIEDHDPENESHV